MHNQKLFVVISLIAALAACGGGSSTPSSPSTSATNIVPVANAGTNQSITAGTIVTLNSSASSDGNNDPLTYTWTLNSKPAGSLAALTSTKLAQSSFTADMAGAYVATLIVNDGKVDSAAATVTITASANSASTATLIAPANGKTSWNLATAAQFSLKDASGSVIGSALTCSSDTPTTLIVAADCSTMTGKRLGDQSITITGGGISAKASVKVIPQRQAIATHGVTSTYGSGDYNLVVTPAGNVLGWGSNTHGVLGQGLSSTQLPSSSLPLMVKDAAGTGKLSNIVAASAGDNDAMALNEDGEVLAWGDGHQFGRITSANSQMLLPVNVRNPANTGNLQHIVQVSVGQSNVVALADDGTVYTWGNWPGQGSASSAAYPNQAKDPSGNGVLSNIVSVSSGGGFTLALSADGKVYGWGWNTHGETGRGTSTNPEVLPATVKLISDNSDLSDIVAISAGYNFSLALTKDGKVYAWGDNSYGALGQGLLHGNYTRAVLVKDVAGTGILSNISMVSAGGWHAMVLDNAGRVYSWGNSSDGELGDGANRPIVNQSVLPGAVVGTQSTGQLSGIVSIATGYNHSMAIATDGGVLIWGDGFNSNLGQGVTSNVDIAVPTAVKDASGTGKLSLSPLTAYPNILGRGR